MKRLLLAIAATGALAAPAYATEIGVSISIGDPGFYGQIDIGGFPRPALLYPQPVLIERVAPGRPPIYLRVPPGHAKHWGKHCREYRACGERVYFVKDDWYTREYAPRYQERYDDRRGPERAPVHRDDHRDDRHDDRRDDRERGHGQDRGHGGER